VIPHKEVSAENSIFRDLHFPISPQDASGVDFPDCGCPVRPAWLLTRQRFGRDVGLIASLNVPNVVEELV
jgi:hypothetical protein